MVKSLAFFQGKVVPIDQAKVSVMTHALHYGSAVFEGIRGNWNKKKNSMYIFRMKEHYERLIQGCKMMMMDIPYGVDELCDITIDLIKQSGIKEDVYITVPKRKKKSISAYIQYNGPIPAPIEKNVKLGVLNIFINDELFAQHDVFSMEKINKVNIFLRLIRSFNFFVWGDV